MPLKSALELTLDSFGIKEARDALSKDSPELTRASYAVFLSHSKGVMKIVTGEADSDLFERDDLINVIKGVLSCNGGDLSLVMHRYAEVGAAKMSLKETNPQLIELKKRFDDKVHIFWAPVRPEQHYAVIQTHDGYKALLEEPHHEGNRPFWATPVYDVKVAGKWSERFDNYIKKCEEITFDFDSSD